jgi:hypothetical protein
MDPSDIPQRPQRITRDEAKAAKARQAAFDAHLKLLSRLHGWGFARGSLFREIDGWFVDALPSLLWGRGAITSIHAKPMGVDPVFWEIVGLPENQDQPLSFRANGAWVVRAPSGQEHLALDETDPQNLAEAVVENATGYLANLGPLSPRAQADAIEAMGDLRIHFASLEVCLRIMDEDWEKALALCINRADEDSGGFLTGNRTFFDQARDWIVHTRRARMRLV